MDWGCWLCLVLFTCLWGYWQTFGVLQLRRGVLISLFSHCFSSTSLPASCMWTRFDLWCWWGLPAVSTDPRTADTTLFASFASHCPLLVQGKFLGLPWCSTSGHSLLMHLEVDWKCYRGFCSDIIAVYLLTHPSALSDQHCWQRWVQASQGSVCHSLLCRVTYSGRPVPSLA